MLIGIKDCDDGVGVIIEFSGTVTDQEYVDSVQRHLTQEPDKFRKYRYSFTDATAITRLDISTESINLIAELCIEASKVNPDPIVAIAADGGLAYGLARMFEALADITNWETMVFKSKEEAIEWIKARVKDRFAIDNLTFN